MSDCKSWQKKKSSTFNVSFLRQTRALNCTWLKLSLLALALFASSPAHAGWRAGGGLGFGGTGIKKEIDSPTLGKVVAEKSEGFGMMHAFVETLWTDNRVVGLEHARGFRMGPFSSGVGFTTLYYKWHFMGPAPEVFKSSDTSTLFIKRWSPYVGPSIGLASGRIKREGDEIPSVSSSGVAFGIRFGTDYLLRPNLGMRLEISGSQTIFQSETLPANMNQFSLWYGLFVPL